jgi:hypothetical protein
LTIAGPNADSRCDQTFHQALGTGLEVPNHFAHLFHLSRARGEVQDAWGRQHWATHRRGAGAHSEGPDDATGMMKGRAAKEERSLELPASTEDGTISGWNAKAGTQSIIAVDESHNPADGDEAMGVGAVYKGLAIGQGDNGPVLFAANFRHGTVETYDQNFNLIKSFTDPHLPADLAPFNVQALDGKLFVTFAEQDATKHDDVAAQATGLSTNSV